MTQNTKVYRRISLSITLVTLTALAFPAFCLGEDDYCQILDRKKVWKAAFMHSPEIKNGLSKFLPAMDATKLLNLTFKKFGDKIFADTAAQSFPDAPGTGNPPRLTFQQQFFLSDFHNFLVSLQPDKTPRISREELRPFMKVLRIESQKSYELCHEYPLLIANINRTHLVFENLDKIRNSASDPVFRAEYSKESMLERTKYLAAIKAMKEYEKEIEKTTGGRLKDFETDSQ